MGKETILARRAQMLEKVESQRPSNENIMTFSDTDEEDSPLLEVVQKLKTVYDRNTIYYMEYSKLKPYPNAKIRLKLHTGEKREALKDSIQKDGILDPILVWHSQNEYYIMAGHNRADIGNELNKPIPCIIFENIDQKQADRITVVTNLYNRQYTEMKPSELYNMLTVLLDTYEGMYKEDAYKTINDEFNLTKRQILIYLRLGNLLPEIMEKVDKDEIAVTTGYVIASFDQDRQKILYDFIIRRNIKKVPGKVVEYLKIRAVKPWDEEFLCMAFGIIEKKEVGRKNTVNIKLKLADVSAFLLPEEVKESNKVIKKSLEFRNDIRKMVTDNGMNYDEDIIYEIQRKAVLEYLQDNKE